MIQSRPPLPSQLAPLLRPSLTPRLIRNPSLFLAVNSPNDTVSKDVAAKLAPATDRGRPHACPPAASPITQKFLWCAAKNPRSDIQKRLHLSL